MHKCTPILVSAADGSLGTHISAARAALADSLYVDDIIEFMVYCQQAATVGSWRWTATGIEIRALC